MSKSIIVIINYFGKWPGWMPVFLESCALNHTIDWHINTNCPTPDNLPSNVRIVRLQFHEYCAQVSEALSINFHPLSAYNLCNIRPMLGIIHSEIIKGYDYFGWSDLDVIYGDIRSIYNGSVLLKNVISSHASICSGHFMLIKNETWLIEAYRYMKGWRERLADPTLFEWHECLDEAFLSSIFSPLPHVRLRMGKRCLKQLVPPRYWSNNHFAEQWSTPFVPGPWINGNTKHPETWYWRNGEITNSLDGDRRFLYLHLMNFKSSKWVGSEYRAAATWDGLTRVCNFDPIELYNTPPSQRLLQVDRRGIQIIASDEEVNRG